MKDGENPLPPSFLESHIIFTPHWRQRLTVGGKEKEKEVVQAY